MPNKAIVSIRDDQKETDSVDATDEAVNSLTPELVIALCGPIGSPLHETASRIKNELDSFNYKTEIIRLSNLIRLNKEKFDKSIDKKSRFEEIKSLISIGNSLRERYGNDILAKLAIAKIGGDRTRYYGTFKDVVAESKKIDKQKIGNQRICHVIDSIKNSAELQLLRLIYGDALFAIGVFSPQEIREGNLKKPNKLNQKEIEKLIDTDSGEEFDHGQSVRDTFPKCDFFLRVDYSISGPSENKAIGQIHERLHRFFNLIFRTKVITPTAEETAMYAAASAARNSACLSRQVGAAVTSANGELLAIGWNDVPQSGGSLYGKNSLSKKINGLRDDQRCFAQDGGYCYNDKEKESIADIIVKSLIEKKVIKNNEKNKAIRTILDDTRIKDLIEFSRAVHAEMHALLSANRVSGAQVIDGKIFITTYPCHSCARHLIAAGISEIFYIEPYRKSLAIRLHGDALTESSETTNKVQIKQYNGIAPRRFIEIFESGSRKEQGAIKLPKREFATPRTRVSLKAIPRLEEVIVAEVNTKALQLPELGLGNS